jgi:hypothetical protein
VVNVVVDKCDAAASAATELAGETLNGDAVLLALQLFDELFFDLGLGDGWHLWVDHLDGLRKKDMLVDEEDTLQQREHLRLASFPKVGFSRICECIE